MGIICTSPCTNQKFCSGETRLKSHRIIAAVLSCMGVLTACSADTAESVTGVGVSAAIEVPIKRNGSYVWIERPWDMRYILFITQQWPILKEGAIKWNAKSKPGHALSLEAVFEPTTAISMRDNFGDGTSMVVIEFDQAGNVITPHTHGLPLRGRLNRYQELVMSAGEGPVDPQYHLGYWFTGLGDVSTHWAPGVCALKEKPSPFSKTDTLYLYGPKFEIDEYSSTFGCREWAYQLYDDERPYIDVTSYVREGKTYPKHTGIKEVIGWARFGDKKPVIGQHKGLWYCLHDCPDNEPPGPISDIKSWAHKQGWKVPRPPTKAPTFPDPPARMGTYPK